LNSNIKMDPVFKSSKRARITTSSPMSSPTGSPLSSPRTLQHPINHPINHSINQSNQSPQISPHHSPHHSQQYQTIYKTDFQSKQSPQTLPNHSPHHSPQTLPNHSPHHSPQTFQQTSQQYQTNYQSNYSPVQSIQSSPRKKTITPDDQNKLSQQTRSFTSSRYSLAMFDINTGQVVMNPNTRWDQYTGSISLDHGIWAGQDRQVWIIKDVRKSGRGGGSLYKDKWNIRTLSQMDGISGTGVLLDTKYSTITLEPGIYKIKCSVPATGIGFHKARWFNLSDNVVEEYGTNEMSASDETITKSQIEFRLWVTDRPKKYQIQHRVQYTRAHDGGGLSSPFPNSIEIYTIVEITRLK